MGFELSYSNIKSIVEDSNYFWFDTGEFNLNIVGIRNMAFNNKVTNNFDDWLTVSYIVDDTYVCQSYQITTDPGSSWMKTPLNKNGTAVLVAGQYRSAYQIGLHQGKYSALVQRKAVKVYRDNNLDLVYNLDPKKVDVGLFGINIHRSDPSNSSTYINKWSAGCQVFKNYYEFDCFMQICNKAKGLYGNNFTYTLLEVI